MSFWSKKIKNEQQDFEYLYKDIEYEPIRKRIESTGNWYIKNAILSKMQFYILEILSIILPLGTTYFSYLELSDVVKITSILTSLITSLIAFTRVNAKWSLYRNAIEQIKRELTLYWIIVD